MYKQPKQVAPSREQLKGEILRAQLHQAYFSQALLDNSFRAQEAQAKAQLYKLWHHVEQLKKKTLQLQADIIQATTIETVDSVLGAEESALFEISRILPTLRACHEHLTTALATTTYRLPSRGIVCTEREDLLVSHLQQLNTTLEAFAAAVNPNVQTFVRDYKGVSQAAQDSTNLLALLHTQLSTITTMETMERSQKADELLADSV